MMRLPIPGILVVLLVASIAVLAQQTNALRVCVYASDTRYANRLAGQVNFSPQARFERDLVVKYLNQTKAPTSAHLPLEAVALTTQNRNEVLGEATTRGCEYLIALTLNAVGVASPFGRNAADESVYEGYGAGVDPPVVRDTAPLTLMIMYRRSPHLWVSYPYGSYGQDKWTANDVAIEAHKTILKNPTP
jgi:hypothetical protein